MRRSEFTGRAVLLALGVVELAFTLLAARYVDRGASFPRYLLFYLAMGIVWVVASYVALRSSSWQRSEVLLILALGLAMRVAFLRTEPVLSDDIFRYVWDGRVQHQVGNPYLYPPQAAELASLRDALYQEINNKDIPTLYPPLMETSFFLVTSLSERVLFMKAFFVLFDVGVALSLLALLDALALNRLRVVVYLWCPLGIVEIAGSGHGDVLGVFFLVFALWAFASKRERLWSALLTASGLAKLVGFALSPLFVRYVRPRLYLLMLFLTVFAVLPYVSAGALAFRGLREYANRWRANDSLFDLLYAATGSSLDKAKLIVATSLVVLVLAFIWKKTHPIPACYWTLGAILLLTPTMHPWYLLWILPLLALFESPAWMFLTVSVALSYHAAYLAEPGQPWHELLWVKALEYLPFYVLGVSSLLKLARSKAPGLRLSLGYTNGP